MMDLLSYTAGIVNTILSRIYIELFSLFSAGVGRTGTFIVIDVMLQKLDNNEPLDIMNYVCRMRAQRGSMVQTSVSLLIIIIS